MPAATHTIPVDLAPTHRARRLLLIVAAWLLAACFVALGLTQHYGSTASLNEGYTLGSGSVCVGFETRGDVGWFVGCDS